MRIHSDAIDAIDLADAAKVAGVRVIKCDEKGSRSRKRAFDFALTGSGVRGGMYGNLDYPTATWDEWGIVLNHLFEVDENARVAGIYEGREHFDWVTQERYRDLTPAQCCKRHRWQCIGNVGGVYSLFECPRCGAQRANLYGTTWAKFAGVSV